MKPRFELHDRVRHTDNDLVGMVISIDADHKGYYVCYDDDYDEYYVDEADIDFENPKMTFLTRLKELLGTFDAEIIGGLSDTHECDFMEIGIGDGKYTVRYENGSAIAFATINANNVFDYEKD